MLLLVVPGFQVVCKRTVLFSLRDTKSELVDKQVVNLSSWLGTEQFVSLSGVSWDATVLGLSWI